MQSGTFTVTLRVTDTSGDSDTDTLDITVSSGPAARIDSPSAGTTWGAGQAFSFSGGGTDVDGSALPASALDWAVLLRHCAGPDCHEHQIGDYPDTAAGSFTAPDHAEPGQIEVRLTATYSNGQTEVKTVDLAPRTVDVSLGATPAGAAMTLNGEAVTAPATHPVVVDSTNTLDAPVSQAIGNTTYRFSSWSDGQQRSRSFTASGNRSFSATFVPFTPGTQTLTFAPEADVRAEAAQPASNFGTENRLRTDGNGTIAIEESYLRFQVAGITGRVTSAKLRLRSTTNTADGPAVRGTTNAWSETGLTWSQPPGAHDRRGQRRGRDRHQPMGRVGRDRPAHRRRAAEPAPLPAGGRRPLFPLARGEHAEQPPAARGHASRTTRTRGRRAHLRCGPRWCPRTSPARLRTGSTARRSPIPPAARPGGARRTSRSAPRTRTAGRPPSSGWSATRSCRGSPRRPRTRPTWRSTRT